MELSLGDKVAVVTGASKGIGLAVAKAFAEEGAKVVAGSRSASEGLKGLAGRYPSVHVAVDLHTGGAEEAHRACDGDLRRGGGARQQRRRLRAPARRLRGDHRRGLAAHVRDQLHERRQD